MGRVRTGTVRVAAALAVVVMLLACDNGFLDKVRDKIARDLNTDADLVSLVPSQGFLSPSFSQGVTRYTVTVGSAIGSVSLTPTTSNPDAAVAVNGSAVGSGQPSGSLGLSVGQNPVSVLVTASDKTTVRTYSIAVCRSAVDIPQTGQSASYAAGDDGDLEQGVPFPSPRFYSPGDGTVTDNLTGLMWVRAPSSTAQTWADAVNYANTLSGIAVGSKDDWRLPSRSELRSLFNYYWSDTAVSLNLQGFSGVQANYYWTSTSCSPDTDRAWTIGLGSGIIDFFPKDAPVALVFPVRTAGSQGTVRLPRTGQTGSYATGDDGDLELGVAWPVPRFTDNEDGTITDNLTGLMWEKVLSSTTRVWAQALTYAENLSLAGHNDWHLPNINQLESITSPSASSWKTWMEGQGFANVTEGVCWSSTTYAPGTGNAWFILTTGLMQGAYQWYQDKGSQAWGNSYAIAVRYCR